MRRKDLQISDSETIDRFLRSQKCGVLTLSDEECPYSVPVNFAWDGSKIIIHSSHEGRKAALVRNGQPAQFTVFREYSVIPSYFTDEKKACHATQFFASVILTGRTGEVTDAAGKAFALNCIMDQVQGPGRYEPLSAEKENYCRMLEQTAIFYLNTDTIDAKFKFGQNLGPEKAEIIINKLLERGTDLDRETAAMMQELRRKQAESLRN
jgi:nitroimidazol reductase NimA-like FMN-containing flavoprotein (pyridoxamine 5'-phosphate oxidase superfamily)